MGEVLDGAIADQAAFMQRAAPFWGDAQGAWYTVGYEMAALVEARVSGAQLATWSPEFLMRSTP